MKTLLVDDHELVLEGLKNLLALNGIEVVGTASNGAEALMQFEMLNPEMVLMDIQMADYDGIKITKILKKERPEAKIVILTSSEDDDDFFAAIQAGADGYLLKGMDMASIIQQLTGLAAGHMPLAPGMALRLSREFNRRGQKEDKTNDKTAPEMTEQQMKLVQLLLQGLTYKEIAQEMNLKEATIRYHVGEILAKLRLKNRAQLIAYASQNEWLKEE